MSTTSPVEALDGFRCSITQCVMRDPVASVDGYSYEREAITSWYSNGNFTSPVTGEVLCSLVVIPNHCLRFAIEDFIRQHPDVAADIPNPGDPIVKRPPTYGSDELSGVTSRFTVNAFKFIDGGNACGSAIQITNNGREAARIRDTSVFEDTIVFVREPLRQMPGDPTEVSFVVVQDCTHMGGMMVGVSPESFEVIAKKMDTDVGEYVRTRCWYIDTAGWLYRPYETSEMTSWHINEVRANDLITLRIPDNGAFQVFHNRNLVVNYPARIRRTSTGGYQELYGFFSLCGNVVKVRLLGERQPAPPPSAPPLRPNTTVIDATGAHVVTVHCPTETHSSRHK
eukprot:GHVR01090779.1.p1 GENE.GHVR01090779.1~~GHVR01090779.1.p1  ORF type:complete len:340 (-),score=59.23 GHVR01090779.1:161-1180(-)